MDPLTRQVLSTTGGKKSTYVDDLFSTYLYTGTGSARSINNGIDLAGEGGMTWFKSRSDQYSHILYDTVRGVGTQKALTSEGDNAEGVHSSLANLTSFNNNGFTIGVPSSTDIINESGKSFASWSFRKAPGFFDVVTWTGNGSSGRQISHNLGSVPGCILIKQLTGGLSSGVADWAVYHTSLGNSKRLTLNTSAAFGVSSLWTNVSPTASVFTVSDHNMVNYNGATYVAYIFAGGESTAATARSVDLDGNDYLVVPDSSNNDFYFGTGDFTVEGWVYPKAQQSYGEVIGGFHPSGAYYGWLIGLSFGSPNGALTWYQNSPGGSTTIVGSTVIPPKGQWHHFAVTRSGNTYRMFLNGTQLKSWDNSYEVGDPDTSIHLGADTNPTPSRIMFGKLSNIRIVKGTAVYTSSFRPPTEPLTNITNTKLLCCNNSSVTGATVTPAGSITVIGNPTASTDSPFDDPEGYKFGGEGDQDIIKCGSYVGNADADGPEINLGWEPQYLVIKRTSDSEDWMLLDPMRRIEADGNDNSLRANTSVSEDASHNWLDLTSTGFKIKSTANHVNGINDDYLYIAVRRPDGLVGKPPEAGTDVFAMAYGSTTNPSINGGILVDFAMVRQPATTENWYTGSRLTGYNKIYTNITDTQSSQSNFVWDYNDGWQDSSNSNYLSWMWKRHAGFDVVTYTGNGATKNDGGRYVPHNLSKTPEMMWVKRRNSSQSWQVWHKGLNGGTNSGEYFLELNSSNAESGSSSSEIWADSTPTATHFILGDNSTTNNSNGTYIAMLFASVDGISKVGYYAGSGSTQTITTGFQPRFLIVKVIDNTLPWYVLDTTRGWASGNDTYLQINDSAVQVTNFDFGAPTSTGFTMVGGAAANNESGLNYIYYAHA